MRKVLLTLLMTMPLMASWTVTFDMCSKVPLYLSKNECKGFAQLMADSLQMKADQGPLIFNVCNKACQEPIVYKRQVRPALIQQEAKELQ
jgi:hypothetical protein